MVGKRPSKLMVGLMVALVGSLLAGGAALAANKQSKAAKILDKVSQEGNTAIREVRWARVAIFDGQPQDAAKILDTARKNLDTVAKQAPQLMVALKSKEKASGEKPLTGLIPIDAWLVLSEDYVPTPEKEAKIKKANEHLKKGEKAKAIEVLRAADIGVSVTRVLMPLKSTVKNIDKAIALVKEQKYYQANLALKGAQDGLIIDTIGLDEPVVPAKKKSPAKKK
jgi:hypothetical protein